MNFSFKHKNGTRRNVVVLEGDMVFILNSMRDEVVNLGYKACGVPGCH